MLVLVLVFWWLFTANCWAKRPSNMPDTRMLTNSKVLLYNGTELQFVWPVHILPFSIGPISTLGCSDTVSSSRVSVADMGAWIPFQRIPRTFWSWPGIMFVWVWQLQFPKCSRNFCEVCRYYSVSSQKLHNPSNNVKASNRDGMLGGETALFWKAMTRLREFTMS